MAGDSQNIFDCSLGLAGFSELASFCGPLLRPQSVISSYFQTVHAREPQVPHGGAYLTFYFRLIQKFVNLYESEQVPALEFSRIEISYRPYARGGGTLFLYVFLFHRPDVRQRLCLCSRRCSNWTTDAPQNHFLYVPPHWCLHSILDQPFHLLINEMIMVCQLIKQSFSQQAAGLMIRSKDDDTKNRPACGSRCQRLSHQLKQVDALLRFWYLLSINANVKRSWPCWFFYRLWTP